MATGRGRCREMRVGDAGNSEGAWSVGMWAWLQQGGVVCSRGVARSSFPPQRTDGRGRTDGAELYWAAAARREAGGVTSSGPPPGPCPPPSCCGRRRSAMTAGAFSNSSPPPRETQRPQSHVRRPQPRPQEPPNQASVLQPASRPRRQPSGTPRPPSRSPSTDPEIPKPTPGCPPPPHSQFLGMADAVVQNIDLQIEGNRNTPVPP